MEFPLAPVVISFTTNLLFVKSPALQVRPHVLVGPPRVLTDSRAEREVSKGEVKVDPPSKDNDTLACNPAVRPSTVTAIPLMVAPPGMPGILNLLSFSCLLVFLA